MPELIIVPFVSKTVLVVPAFSVILPTMRNKSYSFNVFVTGLALVAILLGFLAVPRLMQHVSAQEFNSTGSSKTDDIKGVGVIAFDAPNYRSELAKFLGEKAKAYPEALQRYGLIITNNTNEEIVGYTVRVINRPSAEAQPVAADLYLHSAVANRNSRQYNIKPGEKAWIALTFGVNSRYVEPPQVVVDSVLRNPIYAPGTVIQSILLDSVLIAKDSARNIKIIGPDKLNVLRKIQEERRAEREVAQLARDTANNANGQGKSITDSIKQEQDRIGELKSIKIDGPTGDWYALRKKLILQRALRLSLKHPADHIAQALESDISKSADISK